MKGAMSRPRFSVQVISRRLSWENAPEYRADLLLEPALDDRYMKIEGERHKGKRRRELGRQIQIEYVEMHCDARFAP